MLVALPILGLTFLVTVEAVSTVPDTCLAFLEMSWSDVSVCLSASEATTP